MMICSRFKRAESRMIKVLRSLAVAAQFVVSLSLPACMTGPPAAPPEGGAVHPQATQLGQHTTVRPTAIALTMTPPGALAEAKTSPDQAERIPQADQTELGSAVESAVETLPDTPRKSIAQQGAESLPATQELTDGQKRFIEALKKHKLTGAQKRYIEALKKHKKHVSDLARRREEVERESEKRMMISKARQLDLVSGGAEDGVARRLELRGVSKEVLDRVLAKNGIEILYKDLPAGYQPASPIGAVATDEGTFYAQPVKEAGVYEIMSISPKAYARIARLESDYLRERGLDPARTQFVSVAYGVVLLPGNQGYDLQIVEAQIRTLPAEK